LLPQLAGTLKKKSQKNCQKVVKMLSQSCHKVITKSSQSCQKVVENFSTPGKKHFAMVQ
jgi:hypothetical protein